MRTRYRVGQRVWYVDTRLFRMPNGDPAVWYKPIRGTITGLDIQQHLWYRGKRKTTYTVKYHVGFDVKERNKGYPQQNHNLFLSYQNALEYATLTNEIIKLYPLPQEKRIPPTRKLHDRLTAVRKREPVEDAPI